MGFLRNKKKRIYLDYAASTPVDPRVRTAMKPYAADVFGNPSALHEEARSARDAVEQSRGTIAAGLSCKPSEIIFTSGGTESNSLAILGSVGERDVRNLHLVTSVIEHPSVLECFKTLEKRGAHVTCVGVTDEGVLDMDMFAKSLTENTSFVSIMFANNEVGTLQPIRDAVKVVRKKCPNALFHTDASQIPLFYKLDVKSLGVDLLTIDGQKIYGPKGIGALHVRSGVELKPILYGGTQERGVRPGTENVSGIVGFARAYEIVEDEREKNVAHMSTLRDYFIKHLEKNIPRAVINGSKTERLPNNVNVSFEGVNGEFLVTQLDVSGIACAARSACFGAGGEGSSVVAAIDKDRAGSALRFSLGRETTKKDIEHVLSVLTEKVNV